MTEHPTTVDDYIATLPNAILQVVERVRQAVGVALPDAEERIRYGMPTVMLDDRYSLHYAGRKQHIGLYPIPVLAEPLEREIGPYRTHKGSVRFLYSRPIPYGLIGRLAAELRTLRRA